MFGLLEQILRQAGDRISSQIMAYAPGLIAALFILAVALIIARSLRWLLMKIFKGISIDRFLRQIGLSVMPAKLGISQLTAQVVYWLILGLGFLAALNSFNSEATSQFIEMVVLLFPKLLVAAAIIVISAWLGRYFGRSTLVWAVNENLPAPRKLAAAVRALFIFGGTVAAADHLNFARSLFLAAFILVFGGVVLAAGLALGLGGRESVRRYLNADKATSEDAGEKPLWKHL